MHTNVEISRTARAALFRDRLGDALEASREPAARIARDAGIDRSTLAQLLGAQTPRLPGGHALAGLAKALGVTTDWLLGLVDAPQPATAIIDASVQITDVPFAPADQNLLSWLEEARGYKIRHVPLSLPALVKTEAVLRHEYDAAVGRTTEQAIADSERRLAYAREDGTNFEVCMPRQSVEGFARGEHIWRNLDAASRRAQLRQMATLLDELYPGVRVHLFDFRHIHAVPLTVFGPLRAAIYAGQSYLVFNSAQHVQALAWRFDQLIRAADVQAHEVAEHAAAWAARVR